RRLHGQGRRPLALPGRRPAPRRRDRVRPVLRLDVPDAPRPARAARLHDPPRPAGAGEPFLPAPGHRDGPRARRVRLAAHRLRDRRLPPGPRAARAVPRPGLVRARLRRLRRRSDVLPQPVPAAAGGAAGLGAGRSWALRWSWERRRGAYLMWDLETRVGTLTLAAPMSLGWPAEQRALRAFPGDHEVMVGAPKGTRSECVGSRE